MQDVITQPASTKHHAQEHEAAARIGRPWWMLLAYGGPALPLALAEVPIVLYLPAFYTQEMGLSPGLVGLVFLVARIWDGMSDILVGWLSDRSGFRFGRRKPWVVAGAPILMGATWLLCNPPHTAGLVYLIVCTALFSTADTAVKVPHISWGTELATDYVERSRVTTYRGVFSMLGTMAFVSAPLVFLSDNAPLHDVLFMISVMVLVVVPIAVTQVAWWVPDPPRTIRAQANLFKGFLALAKDPVFMLFLAVMLLYGISSSVGNSLAVFSFGVGLQLRDSNFFWIVFSMYLSTICALPIAMRLAKRIEKHRLLAIAVAVSAVTFFSHLFIPVGNLSAVIMLWVVAGITNAAMAILPTSILADIIDRGEVSAGERCSGSYTAVYNLTMKIGLALGVGLAFAMLDLIGYDAKAAQHTAIDVRNIRWLGFGFPCLFLIPAIFLILKHPITKRVQRQLREEIELRSRAS